MVNSGAAQLLSVVGTGFFGERADKQEAAGKRGIVCAAGGTVRDQLTGTYDSSERA